MHISPICPIWVAVMWLLVCGGLMLHAWRSQAATVSRRFRAWLLALRACGVLALAALLLRPWLESAHPQPGGCRIVVLGDASESMFSRKDGAGGVRRWDALCSALPAARPANPVELWRFGGEDTGLAPWPEPNAITRALPGDTAIGDALAAALASSARPGALPLAAIVLLSDGRNLAGKTAPVAAAKAAKEAGVPISTLCIGTGTLPPDVGVHFIEHRISTPVGKEFRLSVEAENTDRKERTLKLEITEADGRVRGAREVTVSPGGHAQVSFDLPAVDAPGERAYLARIADPPAEDGRPDDDADAAQVTVTPPVKRHLLYLGANPGWEWRFLRAAVSTAKELEIAAILRIGRSGEEAAKLPADLRPNLVFYRFGLPSEAPARFPEDAAEYAPYDAAVVECAAAAQFSEKQQQALLAFVERQGGGVMLTGSPAGLPAALQALLPGSQFEARQAGAASRMIANADFIFDAGDNGRLHAATGLPLLPGTAWTICKSPKKASRTALEDANGAAVLLAEGNLGAGRVAWLGWEESWRWCLADPSLDGGALHQAFWDCLLGWLGANRQPVLQPDLPAGDLEIGKSATLALRVLGPDFLPAAEAQAQVRITGPAGVAEQRLPLAPDAEELGRYFVDFMPEQPGAYGLEFTVSPTPDAMALSLNALALARNTGRETVETAAAPDLMSDLARMTGGKELTSPIDWAQLPLSEKIPQVVTRRYPLEHWWYIVFLSALWGVEWYLRRRIGLK